MKHLLTLTLFLGLVWGQKELHGYWHEISSGGSSVSVRNIYESNGRQFSEYSSYSRNPYADRNADEWYYGTWTENTGSESTKILYDPWFGESYTERTLKDRTIKTEYILIDKNTLLVGGTKYKRGFPDFLPKFNIFNK